ncbi:MULTISPECIES: DUF4440 domain-containing protein [Ferrimonas]|uniref:nuclear transport factor 2 family protein n=1 Tax=Ferrimonas TaxID=44011 RepID=UPI000409A440|nr:MULTISPECIES: nuclear transport factor 2 family protein [Ferrimonas]USD39247.1 nuclear transport factor 2 family protein [Ferrimonas sp. SCSIO 43195]
MNTLSAALELEPHIVALEKRLFCHSTRRQPEQLAFLIHADFIEVSAAGQRFGLAQVLARVPNEVPPLIDAREFQVRQLSASLCQVLYRAKMVKGAVFSYSQRSSLWVLEENRWQMIHHQGTPCPPF